MARPPRSPVPPQTRSWNYRWGYVALGLGVLIAGIFFLNDIFGSNTAGFKGYKYFYIRTGWKFPEVLAAVSSRDIIAHKNSFTWLARRTGYPARIHPGRYRIKAGMSNFDILRLLRSGRQEPVRLVINVIRTKQDLVRLICSRLETDSAGLEGLLDDNRFLQPFSLDSADVMCAIVPDTYDFYWNSSAIRVLKKLLRARDVFWSPVRRQRAQKLGLSPCEVTILASIVEQETNRNDEKPLIAGVYLNRLRKDMKLSADPTVKFALGNFSITRIYGKFTQVNSPYNTYQHTGLPPGPICTPSMTTVDAVLHTPATDFLYFCARPDFSGYHVFAASFAEHRKNAVRYQHALDSLKVK
jgi:UPF0755 protein